MKKYLLILPLILTGCHRGIPPQKYSPLKPMTYTSVSSPRESNSLQLEKGHPLIITNSVKSVPLKTVEQKGAEKMLFTPKTTKNTPIVNNPIIAPKVKIKWVSLFIYYFSIIFLITTGWFIWKKFQRRKKEKLIN